MKNSVVARSKSNGTVDSIGADDDQDDPKRYREK